MPDKLIEFETYGDKIICKRCGNNIAPAIRILGNEALCRAFHIFSHIFQDTLDDQDRMNITCAMDLMVQGSPFNR